MTWLELPRLLDRLSQETVDTMQSRALAAAADGGALHATKPIELPIEEASRYIRAFASDFRWPPEVPYGFLLECVARLYQAKEFVRFVLSESKEISPNHVVQRFDLPEGALLFWLLTDYWNYAGCWRQIYRCSTPRKPAA